MKKTMLTITLGTLFSIQAQAFEIKASATQIMSIGDCNNLDQRIVFEVQEEAERKAEMAATGHCQEQLPERISHFRSTMTCTNYGPWYSMAKLSIVVETEYECR